jgi:O-methyltransferase
LLGRPWLRRGRGTLYRKLRSLGYLAGRDRAAIAAFLRASYPLSLPLRERVALVARFVHTTNQVRAYHSQAQMLTVADRILRFAGRPGLTVVECGCGKGASTAKLSLAARIAGGRLVAYDSFRGIPANDEVHHDLLGRRMVFREGAFRGRLREVQRTVDAFGAPEVVTYRKGLFADTLAVDDGPVDVVLLDVDLVASTATCLAHLYPRLRPGGVVFSQDGHLRAVVALLANPAFWRERVGSEPPAIPGLGSVKFLEIRLPTDDASEARHAGHG